MPAFHHQTVLRDAVAEFLLAAPSGGGRYVDGTAGGGGHIEALLAGGARAVFGIDRDPAALAAAGARLEPFGGRATLLRGTFDAMGDLVGPHAPFDGVVLDVGVSSPQLDHPDRGFSLQHDGPVDMRMDPSLPRSAADLIDQLDADALADILFQYGEEPRSRRIARALVAGRPWTSTVALADAVARASGYRNSRTHPATRTFQALRVAVNDELGQLERALPAALRLLAPGGRLAVISFHSLEDRLVKRTFRAWTARDSDRDAYGQPTDPVLGRDLTRKGVSGREADADNPRARSARLRVFERTAPTLPDLLASAGA